MKTNRFFFQLSLISTLFVSLTLSSINALADSHVLHVISTSDCHGAWFDTRYDEESILKTSLMGVKAMVDSLRDEAGKDNVLLIDAGDALQGDQAAYYYNYVDTLSAHLFPRLVSFMGYDAVLVGNHDIETGHQVYDRVRRELASCGIPYLAGNAVYSDGYSAGKPYFDEYKVFERSGLKILLLGYTNPNNKAWLPESKWSGMDFESLVPLVQHRVDELREIEKPHITIVAVHSGTGNGNGSSIENQGLDLFKSLKGVDLLITAHDHTPLTMDNGSFSMMNCGANCSNVCHATISVETEADRVISKKVKSELLKVSPNRIDAGMKEFFRDDFETVKRFIMRRIGFLSCELRTRDAYAGMSDFMNLINTVQLSVPEAKLSFSAPLSFDATIPSSELLYRDLFTLYRFENELNVVNMTGMEIKNYLEFSYDNWIVSQQDHILKIAERTDPRTGTVRWSFKEPSFNFDSCAGLIYTVDITKPYGSRIDIKSLADGTVFEPEAMYPVAMTSYRASGGGGMLLNGAGIDSEEVRRRTVATYPAIRDLIYEFILNHKVIDKSTFSDGSLLGEWKFIPEEKAAELIARDFKLLF